jgi:type I restriction enzyme S subunit
MNVEMGRINFEKQTNFGSLALFERWMTQGATEEGDVLITMEAPLGNIAQIPDTNRYILSQRVVLLRPKPNLLAKDFLAIQMIGSRFQKELVRQSSGTTAVGIQRAKLELIEIVVPKRTDEQDGIALRMHSMDSQIVSLERELEKLQSLKSGLMADLLTGRVRVPAAFSVAAVATNRTG